MRLRLYDLFNETEFDSSKYVWENIYKKIYKNNLQFPQNAEYQRMNFRYVLKNESFIYNGKSSKKMVFSGDTDFNFKTSPSGRRGKRFLCDEFYKILEKETDRDKAEHAKELLDTCKTYTYTKWNVSIMPCTGSMQSVKQGIGRDRLDTFVWAIDQHYQGHSVLFNHCAAAHYSSLKSYLDLFSNVNEYCECIYHISGDLVKNLVESGAEPIDSTDRVLRYIILAKKFWHQKKCYLIYGDDY